MSFLPDDLRDFVQFGYLTGWRKGEIRQLEWRHIAGNVLRLPPAISKNKDGRVLILVGELAEIIERRRTLQRDTIPWVFFRADGNQVKRFYRSWKTACLQAGLPVDTPQERKRFHDFRRATARDLSRAGIPDRIAMSIIGHKTRPIYDRYNIVNEGDIAQALTQAAQYRSRRGYNLATLEEGRARKETKGE